MLRRLLPPLSAVSALAFPALAMASGGAHTLVTLDDLPGDIVFTEGVPSTRTAEITIHKYLSTDLCSYEMFGRLTSTDAISAVQPCYGNVTGGMPTVVDLDASFCQPGVGQDGSLYGLLGASLSEPGTKTFTLELSYDGSSPASRHGEWELLTDGRCNDGSPYAYRKIGSINVHVMPPGVAHEEAYVATASGSTSGWFLLDHPQLNGNPGARPVVIPVHNDTTPTHLNYGVWYHPLGRWGIYNESGAPMVDGREFLVAFGGERSFLHVTDPSNTTANYSYLDDPRLNYNPNAAVFVTHTYNPPGVLSNYHDEPTGVWYDSGVRRWAIYNDDLSPMYAGRSFNVVVASDFTPGVSSRVGLWPDDPSPLGSFAPAVFSHNYVFPHSGYVPSPISYATAVASCLAPPWDYICMEQSGPADPSGIFTDSTEFFSWIPPS